MRASNLALRTRFLQRYPMDEFVIELELCVTNDGFGLVN